MIHYLQKVYSKDNRIKFFTFSIFHYACEYCKYICKYAIRMRNEKLKKQKILLYL